MSEILKPIDVNQLFRDAKDYALGLESFELTWVEKKGVVDITQPHMQMQQLRIGDVLVPVIKVKYYENE